MKTVLQETNDPQMTSSKACQKFFRSGIRPGRAWKGRKDVV